jgi:hypothetical protein
MWYTRALRLNPTDRFLSALDMRAAIRAVIRSEDTNILPIIRDTSPIPTRAVISSSTEPNVTHTLVEPQYATNIIAPLDDQQQVVTNELSFMSAPMKSGAPSQPMRVIPPPPRPQPSRWNIVAFMLIHYHCNAVATGTPIPIEWYCCYLGTQRISVHLVVAISSDADIDSAFAKAYTTYITQTYWPDVHTASSPPLPRAPPESMGQNADGTIRYQGTIVADIAPPSPQP